MSFVNPTREFKRQELNESFYLGVVKDNKDPLKLGRARVRVPEVHGTQSPDSLLPWVSPLRSLYRGGKDRNGFYSRPDVNSRVAVMFHRGSIYSPVMFAEPRSLAENDSIREDRLEPGDAGFDSNGGEWFSITEEGVTTFTHRSGLEFKVDEDGHFTGKVASALWSKL